ncbi:ATP-dependent Clp protease ATP-binding subunit [Conexibacter stalactiti]|uniref:ATP-dependent Clp protease ATP-binding subunit n=1 Tax=Conexibacter stalactiti TaxID=1940611 RepID=A0ABU4HKH1_9ACTN|nr:ATP-dependent Clp protease ATP-binding subunit [Conexibacter stalactiti]MDW5593204.1 ATP-dependent Clp protease ATP-binding subunit [Conexibacter stalactiti]MEC5033845.1 ATP-dependent Clp protease ATP-binding subunit [Conexibacter stalactiti]
MANHEHSSTGGAESCAVCGKRPGTVPVAWSAQGQRVDGALCETCARTLLAGPAAGGGSRDPRRPSPFGAFPPADGERNERGFPRASRGAGSFPQPGPAWAPNQRGVATAHGDGDDGGSKTPTLDQFGRDLTEDARNGRIDPVIGRDDEIEQTIEVLARRRKNNAVLIGEAGVGKTAIAEGLALRIAQQQVPETLHDVRLVAVDLGGMVAGAQFRGQFEQRLKTALQEVVDSDGKVVLFIDELHTIVGAGGAEGAMDAANLLKPLLARGELRVVGATTLAEYRKIEKDGALARRFAAVHVEEPTVEATVAILRGLRSAYEQHHGVKIADAALEAAARLSDRYVTEYHLPDKAIDLIDQASARVHLNGERGDVAKLRRELEHLQAEKQAAVDAEAYEDASELKTRIARLEQQIEVLEPGEAVAGEAARPGTAAGGLAVTETDVAAVVAVRTGIPVGELVEGELEKLQELESDLHDRVIGQDAAVEVVADTIRRARVGLSEGDRPVGSFLFLGPTGVGKTELVKALAERLFGDERSLVRIDMSEFREPHTVARLIGSPPGYVGYGDGGQLTEPVRRRPYSVVLLDEIEKAHPEVWNVLLQLMDDGRLTDGEGRTVDFTNTILVMTSNLGAGGAKKRGIGFTAEEGGELDRAEASERMIAAAKNAFLPEFVNRIDELVVFDALSAEQIERIGELIVARVEVRLEDEREISLDVEQELIARLAREGFDPQYGARPLQRHVRRTLEKVLTKAIVEGRLRDGDRVTAGDADGEIELTIEPSALPEPVAA